MSLQSNVLRVIRRNGPSSNADVRAALGLGQVACKRVGTALRDLVQHGYLIPLAADGEHKARYRALTAASLARTDCARSLRAAAARLLLSAGNRTMPCARHERLLSLIARAEAVSVAPSPTQAEGQPT